MHGSGKMLISRLPEPVVLASGWAKNAAVAVTVLGVEAVFGTTPSWMALFQLSSNVFGAVPAGIAAIAGAADFGTSMFAASAGAVSLATSFPAGLASALTGSAGFAAAAVIVAACQ